MIDWLFGIAVVISVAALGLAITNALEIPGERQRCDAAGGVYSFNARICFAQSAVIKVKQ